MLHTLTNMTCIHGDGDGWEKRKTNFDKEEEV